MGQDEPRSRGGLRWKLLAVVVAVAATIGVLLVTPAARHPSRVPGVTEGDSAGPTAQVWVTSADGSHRLRHLQTVPASGTRPDPSSSRTPSTTGERLILHADDATGQRVTGFGAALTHSSAALIAALPEERRSTLLLELFDPGGPVRLSVLRVPLGGSDFVTERPYTYDDLPEGDTDWALSRFSTAPDEPVLRSLLREIRAIAPDLRIVASPWSPPAWLKTSGSLEGGRLIDEDRVYRTYATYLTRALEEYAAAGVPIDAITVQNEPQARHPDGYPGMDMPVADQVRVLKELGPRLDSAGLDTRVLAFDHNWELHPADADATPDGADPEADYVIEVLRSDAAPWVDGTAFHCYYGDATAQLAAHEIAPEKEVWVTECSGSHAPGADSADVFADTLAWQSRNLLVASLQNWATAVLTWNLVLDPDGGPHRGGCATCTGVVTLDDGVVTRNAEYYVLAHAARFVPPDSRGLAATSTLDDAVAHVAFQTPTGSVVLIAAHTGRSDLDVSVQVGARSYDLVLPARALATVTLPRANGSAEVAAGADAAPPPRLLRKLDLTGTTISASPVGPTDPCCRGDRPENVLDDDPATRWSTGRPQRPGEHLDLDLGRDVRVRTIVLDAGSTGDRPRRFDVLVRADGERWRRVVAGAQGVGSTAAVDLEGRATRHIRLRLTAYADDWWSVADVRVLH